MARIGCTHECERCEGLLTHSPSCERQDPVLCRVCELLGYELAECWRCSEFKPVLSETGACEGCTAAMRRERVRAVA